MVLLAYELANFGQKIELKLAINHWLSKYLVTIQHNTKFWSMIKKLVWYVLVGKQTHLVTVQYGLPIEKENYCVHKILASFKQLLHEPKLPSANTCS